MNFSNGYKLKWTYEHNPNSITTKCNLINPNGSTFSGTASCNTTIDTFSKKKGRKLSFKRSVGYISDKNKRKELWNDLRKEYPKLFKIK